MGELKANFLTPLTFLVIAVKGCENGTFWGSCDLNVYCVCFNQQWHKPTLQTVAEFLGASFDGGICNCRAAKGILYCTNPYLFQGITSSAKNLLSRADETECKQLIEEGLCPCSCDYMDKIEYWSNETNQLRQYYELSQRLAQLKQFLRLDFKNLSSKVNKKISADDQRPSATATGYIGACILVLAFTGIVLIDFPTLMRQTRSMLRDIRKLKQNRNAEHEIHLKKETI